MLTLTLTLGPFAAKPAGEGAFVVLVLSAHVPALFTVASTDWLVTATIILLQTRLSQVTITSTPAVSRMSGGRRKVGPFVVVSVARRVSLRGLRARTGDTRGLLLVSSAPWLVN
jgi:hypothetical protein